MPVIGYLSGGAPGPTLAAFYQGLGDAGYVEGQNVALDYRWAMGQFDRLPAMAADLVGRKVDVIVTIGGTDATRAAKAASQTIPIVFGNASDPVADGLVTSLARPEGNLTGVTLFGTELFSKRLELLRELVPPSTAIAVLIDPNAATIARSMRVMQEAEHARGIALRLLKAITESEIETAFATFVQQQDGRSNACALVVGFYVSFLNLREQIVALAARHGIPAIYPFRAAGGLISYAANSAAAFRTVGSYTGKILKGLKPADLPVLQPTTLELVVNLKTAKALGITIPPSILARADEVIE